MFKKYLWDYPDKSERDEILQHINGYTFDLHGKLDSVKTTQRQITNSAKNDAVVCDKYYISEMEEGRITSITKQVRDGSIPMPKIWIPFTVVYNGKPRCVFNYTHSINGISINSLIPYEASTLNLVTIRDIAQKIFEIGSSCVVGKEDLKSAFRQSIKLEKDIYKVAYYWRDEILVDWYMPWGVRNAARKCHLISKAVVFIVEKFLPKYLIGRILCYIDDFMFFAKTKIECNKLMTVFENVCKDLGLIVKLEKKETADSNVVLLGRQFECENLWIKSRDKKLEIYKQKLKDLLKVTLITQTDLRSIEGSLSNIAPFAWPLKCLLRRFRDEIPYTKNKDALIFVTEKLKNEAKMWLKLIDMLNGISIRELLPFYKPEIDEYASFDAGNIGFGAFYEPYWLAAPFHTYEVVSGKKNNIAHREMLSCKAAFNAWSALWTGKNIQINTDSIVVYFALAKKDARDPFLMDLVRDICLLAVKYKFRFYMHWVPRDQNKIADALSRLEIDEFKQLCNMTNKKYTDCAMLFVRPMGTF